MKSRWFLTTLAAFAALAVYVGNVLATPATPTPGFAGKTLAMATFGEIDSHIHTAPASWQEMIKTKGQSDLYAFTWKRGALKRGKHLLRAQVVDAAGKTFAVSRSVRVCK